jgi:hypothetical protein
MRPARTTVFSTFGVPISLRYPRRLHARVERILPPTRQPVEGTATPKRYYLEDHVGSLFRAFDHEAKFFFEDADLDLVLDVLDSTLRMHIAKHANPHVFVHAGAVEIDGAALILPGASFAGKSTLVGALVRAGARYMSDEYAILDEAGRVLPYPRWISERNLSDGTSTEIDPASVGDVSAGAPIPLRLVVVTEYRPGADWSPDRLSRGQGGLRLFEDAVSAIARPGDALGVIRRALADAVVLEGVRGEAAELAPRLIEQFRELTVEIA